MTVYEVFDIKFINYDTTIFHGYVIKRCGCIYHKNGKKQMRAKRTRRRLNVGADMQVGLRYNGKRNWWVVQRLIAICFCSTTGDEHLEMQANHINRNTLDNRADNIEWLFPYENAQHWRNDEREKETKKVIEELLK